MGHYERLQSKTGIWINDYNFTQYMKISYIKTILISYSAKYFNTPRNKNSGLPKNKIYFYLKLGKHEY